MGEPRDCYRGERTFPLVLQNVHRYFLYLALLFLGVLSWDVWKALWFEDADGRVSFGIGVGTLVLAANVVLLGGYTLGCHSLRHLAGGRLDEVSKVPLCRRAYDGVGCPQPEPPPLGLAEPGGRGLRRRLRAPGAPWASGPT